jgi:hypothetical protein
VSAPHRSFASVGRRRVVGGAGRGGSHHRRQHRRGFAPRLECSVAGLDEQQQRILQIAAAAREQGIKLTWLGPPCVRTAWEVHSEQLDKVIAATLAETSVAYVSAQTPEFCAPGLHAGDGVHFTMAGYRLLWQKAASAAGIPILEAAASDHKVAVASSHKKVLVCHKKSSSGKKSCHYKLVTPLPSPAAPAPG